MDNLNPNFIFRPRSLPTADELSAKVLAHDRLALSQAITLVESTLSAHQDLAQAVLEKCLPASGASLRVGITGVPGVGKSTFIEALGQHVIELGHRLAVLAIDPSSQVTGGSILGDKTRMYNLSTAPKAFIRPSPAGNSLGGVARKTRETVLLCEAAGFDVVFVETVGVGQSETAVHALTDFFLLLLLPGAGDDLQGIKRGIVEMADLIAVNKADENRLTAAKQAQAFYRNALHLFAPKTNLWAPQVRTCSALTGNGVPEIWELMKTFETDMRAKGFFQENRQQQAHFWFLDNIKNTLEQRFFQNTRVQNAFDDFSEKVKQGLISPYRAAENLLNIFGQKP
jgi:LAO/AO transport system kinase